MFPRVLSLSALVFALCGLLAALPSAAQAPSLCEAVDDCDRAWTTSGDRDWFGQTYTTADDVDAAQSGNITDQESSSMETTIEGPANIAFLWKVSSEYNYDYLSFSIDGTPQEEISGFTDWAAVTRTLAEGTHTLTWEYRKDVSASSGLDAGFVDSFTVYAGGTGSVRAVITPGEAVAEGAQWSLDGGDWQDSGTTLSDVSEGPHTLAFKPTANWLPPASRLMLIKGGEAVDVAGAYYQVCGLVDACDLTWTTGGDAAWIPQYTVAHDRVDAAQAGFIADGQTSTLETTVTGPATVGFWWKVSSDAATDFMVFYVDGVEAGAISGDTPWLFRTAVLAEGSHTLRWAYDKDDSDSAGMDTGWLDEVTVADGTPGDLTVTLLPAGAADAGAQWSVDGGATWQNSGDTLSSLASGVYTLTFYEVGSPWITPAPMTVLVPAGGELAPSVTYETVCEGVGACNRDWTVSGDAGWFTQTAVNHDGHNACKNGDIADSWAASMSTTVTGPVTVSFWWKVSSEKDYDFLTFYVDDVSISAISGEVDWAQVTHNLTDGPHTLTWTYSKDSSVSVEADAGWVDQFLVVESDPPTGSVTVNNGATRTATPGVLLDLTWDDGDGSGVSGVRFSNNGATWSAWQKPAATKAWTLAAGDGVKTVRAQFRDKAGNVSDVYTDTILLDQTPPTGSIVINGGASTTESLDVTLNLTWDDGAGSGVSRMRFSNNGSTWSPWEGVSATKAWTLSGGGYRTVRVQFIDRMGSVSAVYNDYIKAVVL